MSSRGKSRASSAVHLAKIASSRRISSLQKSTFKPKDIIADRQYVAARYAAELSVLRPSLKQHLPDFAQGLPAQPTSVDDVPMNNSTGDSEGMPPLASFEEAEGDNVFMEIVNDIILGHSRQRLDHRTRRNRVARVHANWTPLLEELADAYIAWKARAPINPTSISSDALPSDIGTNMHGSHSASPLPSEISSLPSSSTGSLAPPPLFDFKVAIMDIYTLDRTRTIHRTSAMKTSVALMAEGLLSNVPLYPILALSLTTLELYRRLRLRKPSFSVEAFTKVVCDLYMFPYRSRYSEIVGDAFDIYLRVLRVVNRRVHEALDHSAPNWRVLNACPPCTYELEGEPKLRFRRLICMDGNDSLKQIRTTGQRQTADLRVFLESDYLIPRNEVDRLANEVRSRGSIRVPSDDPEDEWEDVTEPEAVVSLGDVGGDPTDGADTQAVEGCVHNWKAAQSDAKKKSWEIFEENGLFASACRHGLILWINNMVRSGELAKYSLAHVKRVLAILGNCLAVGYDIGCAFEKTIATSSLGADFAASLSRCLVNAYHGYTHNFACQSKNHPNVVEGVGLEDFETMERVFSASNEVAGITRYASGYRRHAFIDMHFQQWDDEKYRNLGTMLYNNYRQALGIIHEDQAILDETLAAKDITVEDLDKWQTEQVIYFQNLGQEPADDIHRITYVDLLHQLRAAQSLFDNSVSWFLNAAPTDYHFDVQTPASTLPQSYRAEQSRTQKIETQRRYASEKVDGLLREVNALEVKLGITTRWGVTSPEYLSTVKYVQERKYRRALDRLQRLVVQRLFELHRLNLSGIAYKARTHLSKSLRTRSRAIRNATTAFNKAAREIDPPKPELDWTRLSRFNYIEEFNLLKDSRADIRGTPWTEPVIREAMKKRLRIKRAHEEIIRCNVELRRLYTYIHDEGKQHDSILDKLREASDPLFFCVEEYCTRCQRVNAYLLEQIQRTFKLSGFSGDRTIGRRVGRADLEPQPKSTTLPLPEEATVSDNDDSDNDEENAQVGRLIDFIGSLTFT